MSLRMRLNGLLLLGLLGLSVAACSRECTTTLAEVTCGTDPHWCCAPSFDGQGNGAPSCWMDETRSTSMCGDFRKLSRSWGTHGIDCYYSVSTGVLTGAVRNNDVLSYCGNASASETAGNVPSCGSGSAPSIVCTVVDAGAAVD
jgi:hypothetical protein